MKTILVADDDPVMARLLDFNLRRGGFQTVICRDGPGAIQALETTTPDLAVIDYMLPGKSGLELIEHFRRTEALEQIPIVVVTGQGKESTHESLLKAGAARVFTKPFSPNELMETIHQLLA